MRIYRTQRLINHRHDIYACPCPRALKLINMHVDGGYVRGVVTGRFRGSYVRPAPGHVGKKLEYLTERGGTKLCAVLLTLSSVRCSVHVHQYYTVYMS
jgi:acid phosphatase class B